MFVVELDGEIFDPKSSGFRNRFRGFDLVSLDFDPGFRKIRFEKPDTKAVKIAIHNQAQMWDSRFM